MPWRLPQRGRSPAVVRRSHHWRLLELWSRPAAGRAGGAKVRGGTDPGEGPLWALSTEWKLLGAPWAWRSVDIKIYAAVAAAGIAQPVSSEASCPVGLLELWLQACWRAS
ncbi:hypothetical protein NDU88_004013 [Pleurodeles waltl]|uniref:Uncharacterized protein n=1 Tax=Pleurodeles waltl TaxID=8319 RepID=A0AAV7SHJ2_PLEWA|nr:hypothetical protein NDU88_004013 [Pleurodeles waltl]